MGCIRLGSAILRRSRIVCEKRGSGGVGARQRLIDLIRAHGAAQRLFAVCAVVANGALHSCVSWPTYRRLWFAYLCSARTPVMRTPFAYAATLFRHSLWRVSAALDSPRQDLPLLDRIAATPGFRAASPCVRRQSSSRSSPQHTPLYKPWGVAPDPPSPGGRRRG